MNCGSERSKLDSTTLGVSQEVEKQLTTYEQWQEKFQGEQMDRREWELRTANGKYLPMSKEEYNTRSNQGQEVPSNYKDWYPEIETTPQTYQQYAEKEGPNPKLTEKEWETRT